MATVPNGAVASGPTSPRRLPSWTRSFHQLSESAYRLPRLSGSGLPDEHRQLRRIFRLEGVNSEYDDAVVSSGLALEVDHRNVAHVVVVQANLNAEDIGGQVAAVHQLLVDLTVEVGRVFCEGRVFARGDEDATCAFHVPGEGDQLSLFRVTDAVRLADVDDVPNHCLAEAGARNNPW